MKWHTIVTPAISRAVGQGGLTRAGVVRVLAYLHNDLPARANSLRRRRDASDPDHFPYRVALFDGAPDTISISGSMTCPLQDSCSWRA